MINGDINFVPGRLYELQYGGLSFLKIGPQEHVSYNYGFPQYGYTEFEVGAIFMAICQIGVYVFYLGPDGVVYRTHTKNLAPSLWVKGKPLLLPYIG